MSNSGNRWLFVLAGAVSLMAHLSLASVFMETDNAAKIAGGSEFSVAIMGDSSIDQMLSGELNPHTPKEYQEPSSSSSELAPDEVRETLSAKPVETLKKTTKDVPVLTPQMLKQQVQTMSPREELSARPTPEAVKLIQQKNTVEDNDLPQDLEPIQSERLTVKTAAILPQITQQNIVQSLNSNQVAPENKLNETSETLQTKTTIESLVQSQKSAEVLEADVDSDLIPVPQFRPLEDYQKKVQTASLAPQQPIKRVKKPLSGNEGKNKSNAKKGTLDSNSKKGSSASTKRGNSHAVGNGNITNYKGKVRRKIARRFNPRTKPAKRDAVVSFTIASNGSAKSIRLARSSGNAKLDRAALSAVKRAAPFPSLPSGKSKLAFHVALNTD